jgi:hypothetical protein
VLYQYASGAPIPDEFSHTALATAFRPRPGRKGLTSVNA